VHAARRVFDYLVEKKINVPVIHHGVYGKVEKDELILTAGAEVSCSGQEEEEEEEDWW